MTEEHPLFKTLVDKRPVQVRPSSLRFAFYGRVSTGEDKGFQDAANSRAWQFERAAALIRGHGEIVTEFFDEGVSRLQPFVARPKGKELLDLIERDEHDFHALVVGEAKRVFAGSQLEDVYYLLERKGVELWIPEVSGRYLETNMSHRIALVFEGIMGRVESDTVRGRVLDTMTSIAKSDDPRWLGGNAPFGYKLVPLRTDTRKGSKRVIRTLAIDEDTAPVARRIFEEYLAGKGLREIAAGLEHDHIPSPTGRSQWSIGSLSTILDNQTYTGFRAYGKQRKVRIPIDEKNPRLGTVTKKTRLGDPAQASRSKVFPELISNEEFLAVWELRQVKKSPTSSRKREVTKLGETEPFRGRVFFEGKKMTMDRTRHGKVRWRSNTKDGTQRATVYDWAIREAVLEWLAVSLSRRNLPLIKEELDRGAPKVSAQVKHLEAEKRKKQTNANNLLNLVESGDPTASERYSLRVAEVQVLEREIAALKSKNLDVKAIMAVLRSLETDTRKDVLDKASNKRLNALFDALRLSVHYLPAEGGIRVDLAPTGLLGAGLSRSGDPLASEVRSHHPHTPRGLAGVGGGVSVGAPGGATTLVPPQSVGVLVSAFLTLREAS